MDLEAIGQTIKNMRKQNGFSQGDLAKGVCTQALISRIEKGQVLPNGNVLYHIAGKLGIDVNYLFEIGLMPRLDYVKEVERQLKILRRSFQYEEMLDIVKVEEKNPLFTSNKRNLQLLLWHKGVYQLEVLKEFQQALGTLQKALNLTQDEDKVWTEQEINISISIGTIYFNNHRNEEALKCYREVQENIESMPYLTDITIKSKLLYLIARVLTRFEKLDESSRYCLKGIQWCVEHDSLYMLGELHYNIGYNYELQEDFHQAKRYLEKALIIFELQHDDKYIAFIKEKIEKWSN